MRFDAGIIKILWDYYQNVFSAKGTQSTTYSCYIPQITKVVFLLYFKLDEYIPERACAIRITNSSIKTDIVAIFIPPVHHTEEARMLL